MKQLRRKKSSQIFTSFTRKEFGSQRAKNGLQEIKKAWGIENKALAKRIPYNMHIFLCGTENSYTSARAEQPECRSSVLSVQGQCNIEEQMKGIRRPSRRFWGAR